jgi:hypothetical protein
MTPEEGRAVAMLQRVRFGMHQASRRFAVWLGNQEMFYELTEPQRAFLWQIAYTFRGQLPRDVAEAAERMRPWSEQHYAARLAAADVVLVPGVPGRRIVVVTLFDDPATPGIFIR